MDERNRNQDSHTVTVDEPRNHGFMGSMETQIFDALSFPILVLNQEHGLVHFNRAAGETFALEHEDAGFIQQIREIGQSDPVQSLPAGRSTVLDMSVGERRYRLEYHRLEQPFGDAFYLLSATPPVSASGPDPEAIRRMKHRFNNYLAPMAGKAEIILFALKKGNYEKVEKAANDIARQAEDSDALDALFDLEPAQESNTITYYVT